jgi:hypothetical protein
LYSIVKKATLVVPSRALLSTHTKRVDVLPAYDEERNLQEAQRKPKEIDGVQESGGKGEGGSTSTSLQTRTSNGGSRGIEPAIKLSTIGNFQSSRTSSTPKEALRA